MKTIVIPDIHNKTHRVDQILASEASYDQVIYLGDYFDDFGDDADIAGDTAIWLKNKIKTEGDKSIFLIGNHDLSYIFPYSRAAYCPGWTLHKSKEVSRILSPDDWAHLRYFHIEHGILFSHAGVTRSFYAAEPDSVESLRAFLSHEIKDSVLSLSMNSIKKIFRAGYDRGGSDPVGGILWCDHSSHIPLEVIPQIYGHTPIQIPSYKIRVNNTTTAFYSQADSYQEEYNGGHPWSLCLDTDLAHYGIIEDSRFTLKKRSGEVIHSRIYK